MQQQPQRILSIDDDDAVRSNIVAYLEDSGFDVVEAQNGKLGIERLEQAKPDLVLVDLRMPVLDGFGVLEYMRKNAAATPVIVVSGVGVLEEAIEALRQGAWDYLTKPITDMRVLEHAVNKALERARLLDERARYQERLETEVRERTRELRETNERLVEFQGLLQEKNQFLETLVESMPNPVFYKGLDGAYLGCNRAFSRLVGKSQEAIRGMRAEDLFPQELLCDPAVRATPGTELAPTSCVLDVTLPGGSEHSLVLYKSHFTDRNDSPAGVVGSFHDITELKRKEALILYQATHDELTGLLNRMGLRRHMRERINTEDMGFALLILDIDDFKTVNDSLGHTIGDKLLRALADRLSSMVEGKGLVARLGGDEFALLLNDKDSATVEAFATSLVEALAQPFSVADHELYATPSIGITFCDADGSDADILIKNADIAMYRSKEEGGGRWQRYLREMTERVDKRLAVEKNIRKGLENEEFVVYYQPKVNIVNDRVTGMEALVRWARPDGTLVAPGEFIPVAEETGLIVSLGEWVLVEACRQAKIWSETMGPLRMAVNISARQFQPNLPDKVAAALATTGLPPHLLELEITETTMMRDLPATVSILERLSATGIKIAIDDFGTGHSSLYYLKTFPIDAIKVDRSFVRDIVNDENDAAIVSTVITMARNLLLDVVAEGVETPEQLAFLREHGCREVQGFYYSKPLPAASFEAWMAEVQRRGRA